MNDVIGNRYEKFCMWLGGFFEGLGGTNPTDAQYAKIKQYLYSLIHGVVITEPEYTEYAPGTPAWVEEIKNRTKKSS